MPQPIIVSAVIPNYTEENLAVRYGKMWSFAVWLHPTVNMSHYLSICWVLLF